MAQAPKAKTVLITGAGSGFGKGAALALAQRGHTVIAATYDQSQADALTREAVAAGITLRAIKLDITSDADRRQVAGSSIDVLINNAAVGESGALAEVPLDRIRRTLETNVIGTIGMIQAAVPEMIKKGGGTIVIVTSLAGRTAIPFLAPYGMTKFALEVAGADLAVELKPFNIRVSMIEPGSFATGFNEAQIATKYSWMKPDSIYHDKKSFITKNEGIVMGMQSSKIGQVVQTMVMVAEAARPKLRYAVPAWQGAYVQILRALGQRALHRSAQRAARVIRTVNLAADTFAVMEALMRKYVIAWILGVPAGLLVVIYVVSHVACGR